MSYLKDNLKEIFDHVNIVQEKQTVFEQKLLEIFEGSIEKFVEQSVALEFSAKASKKIVSRLAPINILPKLLKKMSAVYDYGVIREANSNDADQANISYYENEVALDNVMMIANKYLNLFRYCALEPFIHDGKPDIRVLPPTSFTVWSNDEANLINPTVFIKYVSSIKEVAPRTDSMGVTNSSPENIVKNVRIFHLYSKDEFLIVDESQNIRLDLMGDNQEGINFYGRLPISYLSSSKNLLLPLPNSDMFSMSILVPKLLSDLNYAVKFQSHSVVYTIDVEISELNFNPDSLLDLKSVEGEGKSPSIGIVKPEVSIDEVLGLIKETLGLWFESLGLKASKTGGITVDNAASGISKAIDSAENNSLRAEQLPILKKVELDMWHLLSIQHDIWELEDLKPFSSSFDPSIQYSAPVPYVDPKQQTETAALKLSHGLTSFRRALAEANPSLTAEEITELILEIEEEKAAKLALASKAMDSTPDDEDDEENTQLSLGIEEEEEEE